MSFQITTSYTLVVCNLCGTRGPAFHQDWRQMRLDENGAPVYLCRGCRQVGVWCHAHQSYHRPDDLHRCSCVDCGALYTSQFRLHIERCPACQRQFAPPVAEIDGARRPVAERESLLGRLRSLMWR